MTDYPFHPIACMFPLLEGGEFAAVVDDIRAYGLLESIVLFEGMILDGRNRDRACREAGVEPRYRKMTFDSYADAVNYVISANIHRRHLTAEQKRELIKKLLKANPEQSDRQVAKQTGASHPHVARVRRKLEESGDVETVSTSSDTKGRSQPRRRSKPPKAKPASTLEPSKHPLPIAGNGKPNSNAEPETKTLPASQGGIGPYFVGEHDQLRTRIDGLNAEKRQLEIKIVGLESEVGELETAKRKLESENIGLRSEIDQLKARIAELVEKSPTSEAALVPAPVVAPPTDLASINADLDVRTFAGGGLRR